MRHGSFPPSPLAKYLVRVPESNHNDRSIRTNLTKLSRVGAGAAWMRGWGPCGRPPFPCLLPSPTPSRRGGGGVDAGLGPLWPPAFPLPALLPILASPLPYARPPTFSPSPSPLRFG